MKKLDDISSKPEFVKVIAHPDGHVNFPTSEEKKRVRKLLRAGVDVLAFVVNPAERAMRLQGMRIGETIKDALQIKGLRIGDDNLVYTIVTEQSIKWARIMEGCVSGSTTRVA